MRPTTAGWFDWAAMAVARRFARSPDKFMQYWLGVHSYSTGAYAAAIDHFRNALRGGFDLPDHLPADAVGCPPAFRSPDFRVRTASASWLLYSQPYPEDRLPLRHRIVLYALRNQADAPPGAAPEFPVGEAAATMEQEGLVTGTPSAVTVHLAGGLGNQLFQYAFGRRLSRANEATLYLDATGYSSAACQTMRRASEFANCRTSPSREPSWKTGN